MLVSAKTNDSLKWCSVCMLHCFGGSHFCLGNGISHNDVHCLLLTCWQECPLSFDPGSKTINYAFINETSKTYEHPSMSIHKVPAYDPHIAKH